MDNLDDPSILFISRHFLLPPKIMFEIGVRETWRRHTHLLHAFFPVGFSSRISHHHAGVAKQKDINGGRLVTSWQAKREGEEIAEDTDHPKRGKYKFPLLLLDMQVQGCSLG